MGKPAARISDHHTCPDKTGKIPHVGGPIVAGSPNVFIGGLPAARVGDMMMCIGPPDSIAKGSASVFINGKPAARMGDKTSHNGVIVGGDGSVLIGDAGIVIPPATTSSDGGSSESESSGSDGRSSSTPIIISHQMAAIQSAAERAQGICQVCEDTENQEANSNAN
ncbi:PAAR domain-containing protein [Photobacterium swingsii]|uniref:PAAR domain-containing protein n=1 Tax=Photobacterium swingsii TaxID=680026 RepID=UPI00354B15B6